MQPSRRRRCRPQRCKRGNGRGGPDTSAAPRGGKEGPAHAAHGPSSSAYLADLLGESQPAPPRERRGARDGAAGKARCSVHVFGTRRPPLPSLRCCWNTAAGAKRPRHERPGLSGEEANGRSVPGPVLPGRRRLLTASEVEARLHWLPPGQNPVLLNQRGPHQAKTNVAVRDCIHLFL